MLKGVGLSRLCLQRLVHPAHKAVKMHTLPHPRGEGLEEQIHEKGFTPPHPAPEVKALERRPGGATPETKPIEKPWRRSGRLERSGEPIELLQRCPLSPVFADSPFLQRRLVALTRFCRRGHFLTLSRPWPFFDHGMLQ